MQNAYLRKAEAHHNYSDLHKRILFVLINERKYYSKEELSCLAHNNIQQLEMVLSDLEESQVINVEGCLVRLASFEEFNKSICTELCEIDEMLKIKKR